MGVVASQRVIHDGWEEEGLGQISYWAVLDGRCVPAPARHPPAAPGPPPSSSPRPASFHTPSSPPPGRTEAYLSLQLVQLVPDLLLSSFECIQRLAHGARGAAMRALSILLSRGRGPILQSPPRGVGASPAGRCECFGAHVSPAARAPRAFSDRNDTARAKATVLLRDGRSRACRESGWSGKRSRAARGAGNGVRGERCLGCAGEQLEGAGGGGGSRSGTVRGPHRGHASHCSTRRRHVSRDASP